MSKFHVIIPAAGVGARMGADAPKQYLSINGKSLIQHVIQVFNQSIKIDSIHVILSEQDKHWRSTFLNASDKTQVHYCGGETRALTVLNGLNLLKNQVDDQDWILVHDAARPGLTNRLLNQLIAQLENDDVGGLLALPLADTLKKADAEVRVAETIPRAQLWQAQTPQMFRYATLHHALSAFNGSPTDEAQAVEALGLQPKLIEGELRNMKVTFANDLAVLARLIGNEN